MSFSICADNLAWIDGSKDNPEDLCLHGYAVVTIGNRKLEYDEATVSATALYLLRTLTEDHVMSQDNHMLPCCGHFMIPDEEPDSVTIFGCVYGVDWSVMHNDDGSVTLELEDGTKEKVAIEDYKDEVYRFADAIEDFYLSCSPKNLPEDIDNKNGYIAFWNEWHRRRGR